MNINKDHTKRIKNCVDYAFEQVEDKYRDVNTLTHFAMGKNKGLLNPAMVISEIKKRLSMV